MNLPPEILGQIFDYFRTHDPEAWPTAEDNVGRRTLLAASLVAKSWQEEAQPVLWRDVTIFQQDEGSDVFKAFVASAGTRRYRIENLTISAQRQVVFVELTKQLLDIIRGPLRYLSLDYVEGVTREVLLHPALEGLCRMRFWGTMSAEITYPLDHIPYTTLSYLDLEHIPSSADLVSDVDLDELTTTDDAVFAAIVAANAQSITHFRPKFYQRQLSLLTPLLPLLAPTLRRLDILTYDSPDPPALITLLSSFTALEELELVLCYGGDQVAARWKAIVGVIPARLKCLSLICVAPDLRSQDVLDVLQLSAAKDLEKLQLEVEVGEERQGLEKDEESIVRECKRRGIGLEWIVDED